MPKQKERMAGYVRESDPTLANSTTIDSAAKAIRVYGLKMGYEYSQEHEYKEAISGYSVPYYQRAELMKAFKAAERREFDVFIITEVRALSRKGQAETFIIYETLKKYGIRLETVEGGPFEDSPMGHILLGLKAGFAELERDQSYERMQRGKADRIAIGKAPNGHPKAPYGYQFVDTEREVKGGYAFNHTIVYVDPQTGEAWSEYKVVVFIFDLLRKGETIHGVERILNEIGIPPRTTARKGEPHWRAGSISNLLSNPIYVGEVWANRFKKIEKVNRNGEKKKTHIELPKEEWIRLPDAPAYIDRETYAAIRAQIAVNRSESLRNNKHDTTELGLVRAGHCRCGVCGRTMTLYYPSPAAMLNGTTPAYRCQQRATAKQGVMHNHNTHIRLSVVDTSVREKIMESLQDSSWVRARVEELREQNTPVIDSESVYATIEGIQAEIDNLFDLARYATNDKNRERLGLMMQDLEKQQREAEAMLYDIDDIEKERAALEADIVKFEKWVEDVRPNLTNPHYMEVASYEELRLAIKILGIVVTVYPSQGEWPYRYRVHVTVPAILAKVRPDCVASQPWCILAVQQP